MSTKPRFIPPDGHLQSVTIRCLQGRFLLKPSARANQLIVGVLAKAQARTGVKVFHAVFLSNHAHLFVEAQDARQLAQFMHFVDTHIAIEMGRLYGWKGKFWAGRYDAAIVAPEAGALFTTLRYLMAQSVKEHLVERVEQWPGVHTGALRFAGDRVPGIWVDRTGFSKARRTGKGREEVREADFEDQVELVLSPPPCWADLPEPEQLARLRELVEEVEAAAAAERRAKRLSKPVGRERILCQDPHHRPSEMKTGRRKLVYAASQELRRRYVDAYRIFLAAYRLAAERLRSGVMDVVFPDGCFPPARPFVEAGGGVRAG